MNVLKFVGKFYVFGRFDGLQLTQTYFFFFKKKDMKLYYNRNVVECTFSRIKQKIISSF